MRLVSYCNPSDAVARLGVVAGSGKIVDLHGASDGELPGDMRQFLRLGAPAMERAAALAESATFALHDLSDLKLLPVVPDPANILCLALNFQSHIDECASLGLDFVKRLDFPLLSPKVSGALAAHNADIVYPKTGRQLDYEIELAFVVGRPCRDIKRAQWRDYVAGFTISTDLTLRDIAFQPIRIFEGKNFDGSFPLGPWLVTCDEIEDPSKLHLCLKVNGETRQSESMEKAFFDVGDVLEYWSARMTLNPGDVFTLGTPAGVGYFAKDQDAKLLHPGDIIEAEITGIGTLTNRIVA